MGVRVLWVSVFLGCAAVYPPSESYAQSGADSVAIMEALGRSLKNQSILAVGSRFACYHAPRCTTEELASATRLLPVLCTAAEIPPRCPSAVAAAPPCPGRAEAASVITGYLLHVGVPQIQQDRAVVAVAKACTWSTALDRVFMVGEEYTIERRGRTWKVAGHRSTWLS